MILEREVYCLEKNGKFLARDSKNFIDPQVKLDISIAPSSKAYENMAGGMPENSKIKKIRISIEEVLEKEVITKVEINDEQLDDLLKWFFASSSTFYAPFIIQDIKIKEKFVPQKVNLVHPRVENLNGCVISARTDENGSFIDVSVVSNFVIRENNENNETYKFYD